MLCCAGRALSPDSRAMGQKLTVKWRGSPQFLGSYRCFPRGQAPPAMVGRSPRELGLSPVALHAGWGPRAAPWTLLSLHFLPIPSSRLGSAISEVGTAWPEVWGPYPLGSGRLVGMETCREGRVATWPLSFSDSCVPWQLLCSLVRGPHSSCWYRYPLRGLLWELSAGEE